MSDENVTPEAPEAAPVAEATTDPTAEAQDAQEAPDADETRPGREAAKYRRQLREAETERDALRIQLDAMRHAEVDRLAEAAKIKPAALWASGAQLADLLTEAGTVDGVKVSQAIVTARDLLGIKPLPVAPSSYGQGNVGKPIYTDEPSRTFADAFRPRR